MKIRIPKIPIPKPTSVELSFKPQPTIKLTF
jgi:hypothetical protein